MKAEKKLCKIYVCGNPLMVGDSLPLQLLPSLKRSFSSISFHELDPTENLPEEHHLILIDTILNAEKIRILTDIDAIQSSPSYSLHDLDLGTNLKLMKKLGKIKEVTIIGLPPTMNRETALTELKKIIPSVLSESVLRS